MPPKPDRELKRKW